MSVLSNMDSVSFIDTINPIENHMMSIHDQLLFQIFNQLKDESEEVDLKKMRHRIHRQGILPDDPRI